MPNAPNAINSVWLRKGIVMSNMAEIKRIEAQMADLQSQINALKASALTVKIPAVEIQLAEGERLAGAIHNDDGTVAHYVILLPGDESKDFADANEWAKSLGAELPSRREQALLYANLKGEFQSAYYWSSEQHSGHSDYAWVQSFGSGYQYCHHESSKYRCRAVRRLFI